MKQGYCIGQKSGQLTELTHNWHYSACGPTHSLAAAELGYRPLQSVSISVHSRSLTRLCQNDPGCLTI